jgi:molybdenum cofactor guanylyltransferase
MGGVDKPLLQLGGRPMLAWVIDALGVTDTAISANGDPQRFAAFGCPVLDDGAFADQGPLGGLLAGLDWARGLGAEALLSAPGDTPFLPFGLATSLSPAPCAAHSNGRTHHLVALWPIAIADRLRRKLAEPGTRHVGHFANEIGMRHLDFGFGTRDPFLNINTMDDMKEAEAAVSRDPAAFASGRQRIGRS